MLASRLLKHWLPVLGAFVAVMHVRRLNSINGSDQRIDVGMISALAFLEIFSLHSAAKVCRGTFFKRDIFMGDG
jgi:hypothetical protein